jgi:hypothetical protein
MSERVKRGERMVRLTERFVQNVPIPPRVPGASQIEYTDLEIRGLKLSVGYGGTKAFYLRWGRGRGRRAVRLGAYPMLSVGKARQRAIELKAQLQDGHVPRANWLFDRSVPTFIEFVEGRYLPYARLAKKSSQLEEQRLRARVLPRFGHLQLNQIHPQARARSHSTDFLEEAPGSKVSQIQKPLGLCAHKQSNKYRKRQDDNE